MKAEMKDFTVSVMIRPDSYDSDNVRVDQIYGTREATLSRKMVAVYDVVSLGSMAHIQYKKMLELELVSLKWVKELLCIETLYGCKLFGQGCAQTTTCLFLLLWHASDFLKSSTLTVKNIGCSFTQRKKQKKRTCMKSPWEK